MRPIPVLAESFELPASAIEARALAVRLNAGARRKREDQARADAAKKQQIQEQTRRAEAIGRVGAQAAAAARSAVAFNYREIYAARRFMVGNQAITIAPASLASGIRDLAYLETFTGSGGTAPYVFTVTAGALPDGLALSAGGVLEGIPTTAGDYEFTIRATDANGNAGDQALSLAIADTAVQGFADVYARRRAGTDGARAVASRPTVAVHAPRSLALLAADYYALNGTPDVTPIASSARGC